MALTESQRENLCKCCPTLTGPKILSYVNKEDTLADKEALIIRMVKRGLDEDKEKFLRSSILQPDPQEQAEWNDIKNNLGKWESPYLKTKLENYVSNWKPKSPYGNHLDDAISELNKIVENEDFIRLDKTNESEIISYLKKYPHSVHFQEIDDALWALVDFLDEISLLHFLEILPQTTRRKDVELLIDDARWNNVDKLNMDSLREFKQNYPQSVHIKDAEHILDTYGNWEKIKSSREILTVVNYVEDFPDSPFVEDAKSLMMDMLEQEICVMKSNVSNYDIVKLGKLLNAGLISKSRLIAEGLCTESTYNRIGKQPSTPHFTPSNKKCAPNRTDVYLFGVPSTGKTCVLMALLKAKHLSFNSAAADGLYGNNLIQFVDAGCTPDRTSFVAVIEAVLRVHKKEYPINLVEMPGEDFLNKIADNPKNNVSFSDMGYNATDLLKNDNHKIFYFIIDPTVDDIQRNGGGNSYLVPQHLLLKKFFDILQDPKNSEIMKKVDGLHIIVTKADYLGEDQKTRNNAACDLYYDKYENSLKVSDLEYLCKSYGINNASNNHVLLYTFSLGKFYLGKVFDFDAKDADRLALSIIRNTIGHQLEIPWWEKLLSIFNKPINKQ